VEKMQQTKENTIKHILINSYFKNKIKQTKKKTIVILKTYMKKNEVCLLSPNFKPTSKQTLKKKKKKTIEKRKQKKKKTSNVITTCKRERKG
jgi:hypothetical protein